MRVYLYPTMQEWFDYLATRPDLDEVNFWRPGGVQPFRGLEPGDLFLFRTKAPTVAIGGFAFYRHFSFASVEEAWSLFGEKNGAATFGRFLSLIARHKGLIANPEMAADQPIGCIMLAEPEFWPRERWIPVLSPQRRSHAETWEARVTPAAEFERAVPCAYTGSSSPAAPPDGGWPTRR